MGPKQSTPLEEAANQQITISHPWFKNSKIIKSPKNPQEEQCIEAKIHLANKKEYDQWVKALQEIPEEPENDSLMLPMEHKYKTEGMCGTGGTAVILYENFPYLLSDEISNRESLQRKLFEENELWYLIYTLLSSTHYYHKREQKVGDIRPDNIFINEDGQVKVSSRNSWPGEQTNYQKTFFEKEVTYLSPEEIKDYQFGKMEESNDIQCSETFSIGLCCLDAATLSESKTLYNKNFKFDYGRLERRLKEMKALGYSELLNVSICNMCEIDTDFRCRARDLLDWLRPHEEAIVNLEDFEVSGLPEKISRANQRDLVASSIPGYPVPLHPPVGYTAGNTQGSNVVQSHLFSSSTQKPLPQQPASSVSFNYNSSQSHQVYVPSSSQQNTYEIKNPAYHSSLPSYTPTGGNFSVPYQYNQPVQLSHYHPPSNLGLIGGGGNSQGTDYQNAVEGSSVVNQEGGEGSNNNVPSSEAGNNTNTASQPYSQANVVNQPQSVTYYNVNSSGNNQQQGLQSSYSSHYVSAGSQKEVRVEEQSGAADGIDGAQYASDTIKKIEQQLEESRKMFPA